eukprot:TRINITY_DN19627_c0_g1_i2.p1 TRINITY_DN19627_c0_g1~~TRINITY_DN19627_c0_g1_i2.p1  ORF type:complete len:195 (+),score=17.41 TRINITY_DN19627_c0_g1_i2:109-693(+)
MASIAHLWAPLVLCFVQLLLTVVTVMAFTAGVVVSKTTDDVMVAGSLVINAIPWIAYARWFTSANFLFNIIRCFIPVLHRHKLVRIFQMIINAILGIVVLIGAIMLANKAKTYCSILASGCSGKVIAGNVLAFFAALSYFGAILFWFFVVPDTSAPEKPQYPSGAQANPPYGIYETSTQPPMDMPDSSHGSHHV